MYLNIFLYEARHFFRSKAKLYSYLFFLLICLFSIFNGFKISNKQTQTILEINEQKQIEYENILGWFDKENKGVIMDIVINEDYFYEYIEKVENKEILVNEIRLVYEVQKGDYLGKIAKLYRVSVSSIKEWNKMHSDNLSIGDKLILYLPDET